MEHKLDLKVIFVLIFSFVMLMISLSLYLFMNANDILIKPNPSCNFRDKVYVEDFIYKLDGTLKNNYEIDTRTVGKQEVKAIYQDKHGFYKAKRFMLTVKDKKAPTILVTDEYTINKGFNGRLEDRILCADDYDDNTKCVINGSYNLNEVGVYPLSIMAIDKSGNRADKRFNLRVVEDKKTKDKGENNEVVGTIYYKDVYNKYKNNNTMVGIDISKWQGDIDFDKLKKNNVEFIFIKMAGQKKMNDKINIDPKFEYNIRKALDYNFKVGLYFYSCAKSPLEAKKQARYVIKNIKDYNIELPIVFDWEDWENYNGYNMGLNKLNIIAKTFIDELERNEYVGMLYSSKYYLDNIWFLEDYKKIWVANYGELENKKKYNYWQLCSDGMIDGINTLVDIDVMFNE
ncbi:MAG: GH25 family lysozyme [Bacilli bacterium]|nr:GH25 family lysozyme [Bacilli bacterium]